MSSSSFFFFDFPNFQRFVTISSLVFFSSFFFFIFVNALALVRILTTIARTYLKEKKTKLHGSGRNRAHRHAHIIFREAVAPFPSLYIYIYYKIIIVGFCYFTF